MLFHIFLKLEFGKNVLLVPCFLFHYVLPNEGEVKQFLGSLIIGPKSQI